MICTGSVPGGASMDASETFACTRAHNQCEETSVLSYLFIGFAIKRRLLLFCSWCYKRFSLTAAERHNENIELEFIYHVINSLLLKLLLYLS